MDEGVLIMDYFYTVLPLEVEYSLWGGTPDYSSKEDAESKSPIIDVLGTYMKVISPSYNHDPKPKGWEVICRTIFFQFFHATS